MRRETRKQPWQTFPFWFLILAGLAMTTAWKLDLFRSGPAETAEADLFEEDSESSAPDWASPEPVAAELVSLEQSEPVLEIGEARNFPASGDGDETQTAMAEPDTTDSAIESVSVRDGYPGDARLDDDIPFTSGPPSFAHRGTKPVFNKNSPFGVAQSEFVPADGVGRPRSQSGSAWSTADESAEIEQASASDLPSNTEASTLAAADDPAAESFSPGRRAGSILPSQAQKEQLAKLEEELISIDQLIAEGEDVEANFLLSNLYWKQPAVRAKIMDRLRSVAYRIYFAPTPHYMEGYDVQPGDALQTIARQYDISWEYLAKLNRTDAKKIRPGQKLKVIQGPFAAVVDLSDRELTVHSQGHFVARFEVGVGHDQSAPIGKFQVLEKQRDPTYYGPEGVVEHDDPTNPLGEHLIDLGDGLGIHGTSDDRSIAAPNQPGCIRLKNREVADLYDLLTTGAEVTIRR